MIIRFFPIFQLAILIFALNLNDLSHAQSFETREITVSVTAHGAEARSEAFQKAIEILSTELASSRLGEEFFQTNRKKFENEVLSQSSQYIQSVRGKGVEGANMKVELSYSSESFERLLRQTGLLQLSRQSLRAVVFLEDKEQAVGVGPWWAKEKPEIKGKTEEVFKALSAALSKRGIEVITPQTVNQNLPMDFKKANLNRDELVAVGTQFGATLVYFGLISQSQKGGIIFHGQWIQVPASRILEEVQGEKPNMAHAVEEILAPVKAAQAQGTLNTKPFQLTIRGSLSPKELFQVRDQLRVKVKDLRSMKERVVKKGEFTYEAESSQPPNALANILKTISFQDFQHRVSLNGEDEILLLVEKR